jgi:hypothetical protein
MKDAKCKHASCNCTGSHIRSDGYCSNACSRKNEVNGGCACGHPSCSK